MPRRPRRPKASKSEMDLLRFMAGMYFTLDTDCIGIDEMAELPQFSQASRQKLRTWAEEDRWLERRQANLHRWRDLIEQKMGQSLVARKMQQMEQLEGVWAQSLSLLNSPQVRPTSWEGVAGVTLRLADTLEKWRASLAADSLPTPGQAPASASGAGPELIGALPPAAMPSLSMDEAQAAAHLVLRLRKEAAFGPEDEDDGETEKPDEE